MKVETEITDIKGTFTLSNGLQMPYFGLGTYKIDLKKEMENAVHWAFEAGYRHFDTASAYENERILGDAIRSSNPENIPF